MVTAFSELHEQQFDVVIIGGGINGASAAQNIIAAGYSCLVVDGEDFGSGSTGRSSRVLHNGLRYFDAPNPLRHYGLRPDRFLNALQMARNSMRGVSELSSTCGKLVWPFQMCFPVYRDDKVKPWHISFGLQMLNILGRGHHQIKIEKATSNFDQTFPFANDLRDTGELQAMFSYTEYKLDWPERICMDMLLDAEENGAVLKNYCRAKIQTRDSNDIWLIELTSSEQPDLSPATVGAKRVLNMAGSWVDSVFSKKCSPKRLIEGAKGTNFLVRLPERYQGYGITSRDKQGHHVLILPYTKDIYSIGVTETEFKGDARDVRPTEDEINHLLTEVNHLLPGANLKRTDVLKAWSGVRPHQYDGKSPLGVRARTLHDLSCQNLPGIFALTAGPIMTHRSTGRMALEAIQNTLQPSEPVKEMHFNPYEFGHSDKSTVFTDEYPQILEADLEYAASHEHGATLADVLLRRTGLAWYINMSPDQIRHAAKIIGQARNWSEEQQLQQANDFMRFLKEELWEESINT